MRSWKDEWFKNEHQPARSSQENISSDKVSAGFSEATENPFGFTFSFESYP